MPEIQLVYVSVPHIVNNIITCCCCSSSIYMIALHYVSGTYPSFRMELVDQQYLVNRGGYVSGRRCSWQKQGHKENASLREPRPLLTHSSGMN
jgi:hypothetical protein